MVKLIRWLRGFVIFELTGKFPERFINICARLGVSLFSPVPRGRNICGGMLLCDYRRIRSIARKCGVRLCVKERHGLPFFVSRYRARSGLAAGAAAFAIIIVIMQSFVWTVEINGLSSVSSVEFAGVMEEAGICVGSLKGSLDLQGIQRKVMQDVEEIGWMSINIIGTKAEVEIKEKDKKPKIENVKTPCNIKASTDGVIVSMNTKSGKAVVPVGSAVKKGQLVVSGVVENSLQNINFVHSDAQIVAKTTRQVAFSSKLQGEYKTPIATAKRYRFDFLWFGVPVSLSPVGGDYSSRVESRRLFLNNTEVPCGISAEHCTVFENTSFSHNEKIATEVTAADEALFRLFALKNCETIEFYQHSQITDDVYTMNVIYTCTEDIGVKEKFVVN